MVKDKLEGLKPEFKRKIVAVLADLRGHGLDPWVFEGLRTAERQAYLYSLGRRGKKGEKPVTYRQHSRHQDGVAADIISATKLWNPEPLFWELLGRSCHAHGLVWGGEWRMRDLPHCEMP